MTPPNPPFPTQIRPYGKAAIDQAARLIGQFPSMPARVISAAERLGIRTILAPRHAGILSAVGRTVRIHAGLEDPDDLIADFEQALEAV